MPIEKPEKLNNPIILPKENLINPIILPIRTELRNKVSFCFKGKDGCEYPDFETACAADQKWWDRMFGKK